MMPERQRMLELLRNKKSLLIIVALAIIVLALLSFLVEVMKNR